MPACSFPSSRSRRSFRKFLLFLLMVPCRRSRRSRRKFLFTMSASVMTTCVVGTLSPIVQARIELCCWESTPDEASEMEEELVEAFKLFATGGDELSGANGGFWWCVGWVEREGAGKRGFFRSQSSWTFGPIFGASTAHSSSCLLVESGGWRRRRKKSQLMYHQASRTVKSSSERVERHTLPNTCTTTEPNLTELNQTKNTEH